MSRELDHACATLGDELLRIYERALCERQPNVAEQLLRSLEELAVSEPACRVVLDQAYLIISRPAGVKA